MCPPLTHLSQLETMTGSSMSEGLPVAMIALTPILYAISMCLVAPTVVVVCPGYKTARFRSVLLALVYRQIYRYFLVSDGCDIQLRCPLLSGSMRPSSIDDRLPIRLPNFHRALTHEIIVRTRQRLEFLELDTSPFFLLWCLLHLDVALVPMAL